MCTWVRVCTCMCAHVCQTCVQALMGDASFQLEMLSDREVSPSSTVRHCPALSSTVRHCPAQSGTVQHCPAQSGSPRQGSLGCPALSCSLLQGSLDCIALHAGVSRLARAFSLGQACYRRAHFDK